MPRETSKTPRLFSPYKPLKTLENRQKIQAQCDCTTGAPDRSSAPYLACTPCVSLLSTLFNRGGNRSAFRLSGAGGGSFPLDGGTFARSYPVSRKHSKTKTPRICGTKKTPRKQKHQGTEGQGTDPAFVALRSNRAIGVHSCSIQGLLNGGVSNGGGFPNLDLSFIFCPFLSFLGLSRFFWDFPICSGMVRGFSRFVRFLFLGLSRAPMRNSPETIRDTFWTFPEKKWETPRSLRAQSWAAANGGVTNGGLRGVCPPFMEIGRNRPKSPFFCLFRPFPEGSKSTWEIQKTEEKRPFSSDILGFP